MAKKDKEAQVGTKELISMLTLFVASDIFLSYPSLTAKRGLEAGWMMSIVSGIVAMAVFLFVNWMLHRTYPGQDLIDVTRNSMGQIAGLIVSVIVGLYLLMLTAAILREFMENIISTVLPNTPILVVAGLFGITVCYIAQCGLEGICRTAVIIWPVLLTGLILLFLATSNRWSPTWLLPIWGSGFWPVVQGGVLYSSLFTNVLLICLIYPHAHRPEELTKVGVWSIVLTDTVMTLFIVVFNMIFPAVEGRNISFPFYEMARIIYLGRFFQRLESIFIFIWVAIAIIRVSMTLWASAYAFSRGFKWPTFKPGVPVLALASFTLSLVPKSAAQVTQWTQAYLLEWGNLVVYGLPILIVLVAAWAKRSGGGKGRQRAKKAGRSAEQGHRDGGGLQDGRQPV